MNTDYFLIYSIAFIFGLMILLTIIITGVIHHQYDMMWHNIKVLAVLCLMGEVMIWGLS